MGSKTSLTSDEVSSDDYSSSYDTSECGSSGYESSDEESSGIPDPGLGDEIRGEIIDGRYILLHKIGSGAYASVWLSYFINDPKKNYYYAIKVQNPEDYSEGINEIKMMTKINRLNSPYLITLLEHFEYTFSQVEKPALCMVFELMACSTYQLIRRGKYKSGLPPDIVVNIMKQVIKGLDGLHQLGLIHGDIKPENILIKGREQKINNIIEKLESYNLSKIYTDIYITEKNNFPNSLKISNNIKKLKNIVRRKMYDKVNKIIDIVTADIIDTDDIKNLDDKYLENIQVVIADFGSLEYCKNIESDAEIQTRYYRAPEVLLQCYCDEKCDIWSLGCLMYEILTGEILFNPDKDSTHCRDYYHIMLFYKICGNLPDWMINKSPLKNDFFNKKRQFIDPINETINIYKNINNFNDDIIKIFSNTLILDPKLRPDSKRILHLLDEV